jgi:IrrE N-terminal-like domain
VAGKYCDVQDEAWPFECDALAVGLGTPRPIVLMRRGSRGTLRRRFTMAHELGHVILAWHVGRMICSPVRAAFDDGVTEQESEANHFASALLVPRRFLEEQADEQFGSVVEALNDAQVSAAAAVLALTRNLLPGCSFLIDEDEDGFRLISSSGTVVPGGASRRPQHEQLRSKAHDMGEAVVSGRRVLWFQFAEQNSFSVPDDPRETTALLLGVLASALPGQDAGKLQKRINGIVGGMLGRQERAQSEAQALAVLEQRFAADPDLCQLMELPDFRLYLRRKAADRVKNASA